MSLPDENIVIRDYLLTNTVYTAALIALVVDRVHQGRLPENATLPAISFFCRGGGASYQRPAGSYPSVQFDCWADSQKGARTLYRALYDALQGAGNAKVTVDGSDYYIIQAREEVHGQDIVDAEIQNYYRVLSFYQVTIRSDL